MPLMGAILKGERVRCKMQGDRQLICATGADQVNLAMCAHNKHLSLREEDISLLLLPKAITTLGGVYYS